MSSLTPTITDPLPKQFMGGSWSQDQGVDINGGTSAIAHAPLIAVGDGTIVGHGISGFGDWAPILKLAHPIQTAKGLLAYVYYGHAGPGRQVPVGTQVKAGDPIGEVGAGIVGMSSGPHLEIGFSDIHGTPIPGSSSTMLALLHGGHATTGTTASSSSGGGILPDLNPLDAINNAINGLFSSVVQHAKYAALVAVAVIGGFLLVGRGVSRATHQETA